MATGSAVTGVVPPPPGVPAWRELVLDGRKLGLDTSINIRSALLPTNQASADWLPTAAASVVRPRGEEVLLIESKAKLAGRVFDERLWLDPPSRAAIQIDDTETGARNHRRVHRLLSSGFLYEQRQPADGEESGAPPSWTRLERTAARFPPALPASAVVTGALALVGADVLDDLHVPGDHASCIVLVQSQIEEVTVTVESAAPAAVAFVEHRAEGDLPVSGMVDTLVLAVSSRPVDASAAGSFRLFGLERAIHVVWEPRRRVPLRISGQVRLLGQVSINLSEIWY